MKSKSSEINEEAQSQGLNLCSELMSSVLAGGFFTTSPTWETPTNTKFVYILKCTSD